MFSERLKELRKKQKRTQADIANVLGVTVRQYQRYESGEQTTTIENLMALARYFNVSIDYLVGETDIPYRYRSPIIENPEAHALDTTVEELYPMEDEK